MNVGDLKRMIEGFEDNVEVVLDTQGPLLPNATYSLSATPGVIKDRIRFWVIQRVYR